jgi:oligopeptide transport system permease protein
MENKVIDLQEFNMSDEELFSQVDNNKLESEKITAPRYSYWKSVFRVFFRDKLNIVLLALLLLVVVFAYIYPMCIQYDRFANINDLTAQHLTPSQAIDKYGFSIHYILGTGGSGEPMFDSIWFGARISISLALICAAINMTVGIVVGAIWGFSKKVDKFMTEVYNIIGNVPTILFISVMVMIMSASFWTLVFAMTITGWLFIAYFIRTQVIIIRDREYNLASKCLGTPIFRIAMRNILPFMTSIIVTLAATEIPSYISSEVFLSYIGIGMSDMSLGKIIEMTNASMFVTGRELEFWAPVAVTAIITIVLYVVGQKLGDASDPRTHM